MYIGHYAAAAALLAVAPEAPTVPIAVAVALPDLVWPVLVYLKKEEVAVDPRNPLQRAVRFVSYPHSHSLVRSSVIDVALAIGVGFAYRSVWVGILFWLAVLSHWLLDAVVHVGDLPVLGRLRHPARDRYVGLGAWRWPLVAFAGEYLFLAGAILAFAAPSHWSGLLTGALILHLFNSNSYFAWSERARWLRWMAPRSATAFATMALVGFAAAIWWFANNWAPAPWVPRLVP